MFDTRITGATIIDGDGGEPFTADIGTLAQEPLTIQLRYLSTLAEIGMEQNSVIVFPLPIDMISHFFSNSQQPKKEGEAKE